MRPEAGRIGELFSIRNLPKPIGSAVALNSATFSMNEGEVVEAWDAADGDVLTIEGLIMGLDLGAVEAAQS